MINERGEQMVEHHVKYLELHGVDETEWMTRSEHQKLHRRLRKEGKCNIPSEELRKIAVAANGRTDKSKSKLVRLSPKPTERVIQYMIQNYPEDMYGKIREIVDTAVNDYLDRQSCSVEIEDP